jgi:hypothetical protein
MRVSLRTLQKRLRPLGLVTAIVALGVGCEDKKPVPATVESAAPPPAPIAKHALAELEVPADIVVFGGIEDVGKIADPLSTMASGVTRAPMQLKSQLPRLASETLGLTSADAIDFDKPVRLAVLDPKKHVRGFGVFMVHVKDEQGLVAASPPNRATNDQGNAYGWDVPGGRMYLNMVGDVAVFTMEPATFSEHQQFLKELSVASAPGGATLVAKAANVVALYSGDFETALAGLKAQAASATGPAAQGIANVVKVDEGMFALLKELDTLTLSLRPTDDGLVLGYAAKPRAGTALETTLRALKPRGDNALLARFPKSTAAYLAASLDPSSMATMRAALEWVIGLSLPPEQASQFVAVWSDMLAASTGDVVVGAYKQKDGFAIAAMSGVSDQEKARAAKSKMLEMYDDPKMKESLAKAGVKAEVKAKAYKIGDVDVSVSKSEIAHPPPGAEAALALMAPMMEAHSAITKDAAVIAYGPSAKETLTTLIDPKSQKDPPPLGLGDGPGAARAKKNGAPNAFVHAFIVAGAFTGDAGGADGGIVLTVGANDGVLEIDLDVPTAQIGPTVMALTALKTLGSMAAAGGAPTGPTAPKAQKPAR